MAKVKWTDPETGEVLDLDESQIDPETGEPTERPQSAPDPLEVMRAEFAELKRQNAQMANALRQLSEAKGGGNGAAADDFRDGYGKRLDKIFQTRGLDLSKPEIKLWREIFADVFDDFKREGLKDFGDWQKKAEQEIFNVKDQAGLAHFLLDPANANLKREILPELRRIFYQEGLFDPPEGHQGEWNGWPRAYERLSSLGKLAGGEPGRPSPKGERIQTGAPSYPPSRDAKTDTFKPKQGSFVQRFLKEQPDFASDLQDVGATGLLRGDLEEE